MIGRQPPYSPYSPYSPHPPTPRRAWPSAQEAERNE